MKTRTKGILCILLVVGAVVVAGLAIWSVSRAEAWKRDYGQAEPLAETIWPMADEMKRFSEERGRSPISLDEIARYSPDRDFSPLRSYTHEFTPSGPRRFFLRVNSRFAFAIDDQFQPAWSHWSSVLGAPTDPH